jgi:hypothetical protein
VALPQRDCPLGRVVIRQTALQTLPGAHGASHFDPGEPAAMRGRIGKLPPLSNPLRCAGRQGHREGRRRRRGESVSDYPAPLCLGLVAIDKLLPALRDIRFRAPLRDLHRTPATPRFEEHTPMTCPVALVVRVVPLRVTRLDGGQMRIIERPR